MPVPSLTITLNVSDVPKNGVVHLRDRRTNPPTITTADKPPHTLTLPLPADGESIPFGVEVRANKQSPLVAEYVLTGGKAVTVTPAPSKDSDPEPQTPPSETEQPDGPTWPLGFGACADADDLANGAAAALGKLGVTHCRWFAAGAQDDGGYVGNDAAYAAKINAAGLTGVARFGVREAKYDKATGKLIRPATPLTEKQLHKYWAGVAAATRTLGNGFVVELENESNLPKYLDLGQRPDKVSADVVRYNLLNAKIARTYLPNRRIVGPTVGWEANAGLHVDYLKALLDGGLVSYISIIGTHAYVGSADQMDEHLGGIRSLAGTLPVWATETANKKSPSLTTIAALPAIYRKHNVLPFWFRGNAEEGEPRWSDKWSILDANGRVNDDVAGALGLKVAA